MSRHKPRERYSLTLAAQPTERIVTGSHAFALNYLVAHELNFAAMNGAFRSDEVGTSANDPPVMRKVVLLAYC